MPLNPLRAPVVIEASVPRVAPPVPPLTGQSIVSMPLAVSACADGAATSELVAWAWRGQDVDSVACCHVSARLADDIVVFQAMHDDVGAGLCQCICYGETKFHPWWR